MSINVFPCPRLSFAPLFKAVILVFSLAVSAGPAAAQGVGPSSGLPMPRFVSVDNAPSNVRVGPGTQYDIAWTFVRPGVPVEIVQEFDTWRKIRDVQGEEGWVHQGLVVSDRTALVTPWSSDAQTALRSEASGTAAVRAWLGAGILVNVSACDGQFCEIAFTHAGQSGRTARYAGYVVQEALWGVYEGEVFD